MLEAIDLECVRGDRQLFAGVSFRVDQGECLQVQGANGAGKTSLLRLLAGLAAPAAGGVCWDGQPIRQIAEVFRSQLFFLGHAFAVKEELTALENIITACALSGEPVTQSQALSALMRFGLKGWQNLPARALSQGQKRRVALARLVLVRTRLWILDEPLVALDSQAIAALTGLIEGHLASGGITVLTSHQSVPLNASKLRVLQLAAAVC